jgi:hypothetical protein
MAHSLFKL